MYAGMAIAARAMQEQELQRRNRMILFVAAAVFLFLVLRK